MRILADENCDREIVDAIIADRHDVLWIAQRHPEAPDEFVYALALESSRVLLTHDLDFGEIQMARRLQIAGLICMRFGRFPRRERARYVVDVLRKFKDRIPGHIAVIEPGRVRFRSLKL